MTREEVPPLNQLYVKVRTLAAVAGNLSRGNTPDYQEGQHQAYDECAKMIRALLDATPTPSGASVPPLNRRTNAAVLLLDRFEQLGPPQSVADAQALVDEICGVLQDPAIPKTAVERREPSTDARSAETATREIVAALEAENAELNRIIESNESNALAYAGWKTIANVLDEVDPKWEDADVLAVNAAVKTIRRLADQRKPAAGCAGCGGTKIHPDDYAAYTKAILTSGRAPIPMGPHATPFRACPCCTEPEIAADALPRPEKCPTCDTLPPHSSWRWASDHWQHKCPNMDANAGHFTMPSQPAPTDQAAARGMTADEREAYRDLKDRRYHKLPTDQAKAVGAVEFGKLVHRVADAERELQQRRVNGALDETLVKVRNEAIRNVKIAHAAEREEMRRELEAARRLLKRDIDLEDAFKAACESDEKYEVHDRKIDALVADIRAFLGGSRPTPLPTPSAWDRDGALTALLNAHRRFHGKVGCPGDGCYVCEAEEAHEKALGGERG